MLPLTKSFQCLYLYELHTLKHNEHNFSHKLSHIKLPLNSFSRNFLQCTYCSSYAQLRRIKIMPNEMVNREIFEETWLESFIHQIHPTENHYDCFEYKH